MSNYYEHEEAAERRQMFARPGSALRRATRSNPRIHPCPTCKEPNRLTGADVENGYQCDACARRDEGGFPGA